MKKSLPKSWETKMSIFRAAMRLLDTKDIDKITIRDIVKAAGVSVGTFYNYYDTKIDVYFEAYKLIDEYFEDVVYPNIPQGSTREKLVYYFDQYHYYNTKMTTVGLYNLLNINLPNPKYREYYGYGIQHVLLNIIQEGQKSGEITSEEPASEIVLFLLNCMRGIYRHWVLTGNTYDINNKYKGCAEKLIGIYLKD